MTRILFVEDDEYIREIYQLRLAKQFKAEVVCASSGKKAIAILKADTNFDVIISDYSMPDGLGIEVLGFKLSNSIDCPFIFFTNTFEPEIPFERNTYVEVVEKGKFDMLCQSVSLVIGKKL